MQLNSIASTGGINLPWPTILNGKRILETQLSESQTCIKKCGDSPKCASSIDLGEFVCDDGLTYFRHEMADNILHVYGVRGPNNKTPINSYTKEGLKGRYVSKEDFEKWVKSLELLHSSIEKHFLSRQSEMLDPLHDPTRIAKQIHTIANKLAREDARRSGFEPRLENAAPELKTLVKAADLLADSFELLTIYFNPDAASFGRKSSLSLHGLLTKLVSIFRIDDGGLTRSSNQRIYIHGECHRNAFVHESFKLIPFALLTNAVKYSMTGSIEVTIVDRNLSAEITVQSIGPYIEEDERSAIFKKRGRGKWAKTFEGRGVGLFLADIIAKVHGFQIKVSSRKTGSSKDGIPLATNCFSFEVPYQR